MAFGTNKGERRPVVFLDLCTKASDPDGVGFRQRGPNPDAAAVAAGAPKSVKVAMHQFVEGRIVKFGVTEEPSYDDKTVMNKVGHLRLADVPVNGAEAGPDVIVKYRLNSQHGRKLTGLIANALSNGLPCIHIKTNRADAGDTIGDRVLEKAQAFVTMNNGDAQGPRVSPPYYIDSSTGEVRMNEGKVAELPRGVEVVINRKSQYDFSDADAWVDETAAVLQSLFELPADEAADTDAGGADEGVDLDIAAAAAQPRA